MGVKPTRISKDPGIETIVAVHRFGDMNFYTQKNIMIKPVSITPKALEKVKEIMKSKGVPDEYALRLMASGGSGCGGVVFRLGFDRLKDGDEAYEEQGVPVIFEKRQMMFLIGTELDFEERRGEQGFVFNKK